MNILGSKPIKFPAKAAAGDTRHVKKKRRHNLNTHMHASTTPIIKILATSNTRHIVLPEDGPIRLKHEGVNDEIL